MKQHQAQLTLKLNTAKSTKVIEVKVEKSSHKHSKRKIGSKEVKSKEITLKKILTPSPEKVVPNFQEIYNNLHSKFPNVINIDNPVIFAIGVHREIAKELGISNRYIGKWLSWYTRKSNYYNNYKKGMERYNLAGEQCRTVTEKEASYASSKTDNLLKKKEEEQEITQ